MTRSEDAKSGPDKKDDGSTEIGCLNRAHREIVYFKIPKGRTTGLCPKCGRKAGK